MAIEAVSSYSSGMVASRPPEAVPGAEEAAAQRNDAVRIAEADRGASPQYVNVPPASAPGAPGVNAAPAGGGQVDAGAVVNDPEGSIQRAQTLIQSVNSNGAPSEAETRRAAEAYQAASSAQSELAQRQEGQGARSTDVLA